MIDVKKLMEDLSQEELCHYCRYVSECGGEQIKSTPSGPVFAPCVNGLTEEDFDLKSYTDDHTFGTQIEERRLFTYEERKAILKSSYGICAHCGKKLTTKTMTVEHVIPISRGGTSDMVNLTALCPECNQKKGNMLYLPYGFYSALRDKPRYDEMQKHVADWFASMREDFDAERYPLIAPKFWQQIEIRHGNSYRRGKMLRYIPSFQLRWEYVGSELFAEVEAVTGISIRQEKQELNKMCKQPDTHPIALYVLKNPATEKLLALTALCYCKDSNTFLLDIPWMDLAKTYQGPALKTILLYTLDVFESIYKREVPYYCISTPYYDAYKVMEDTGNRCFGVEADGGEWIARTTEGHPYYIARILRSSRMSEIEEIRMSMRKHFT